jgi:hypothetical protein
MPYQGKKAFIHIVSNGKGPKNILVIIDRYDFPCGNAKEYLTSEGKWVKYEVYQKLEGDCDRLEETIAGLENALAALKESNTILHDRINGAQTK